MHYLLTGGAGFIGTHLTLRLVQAGHKVTVLDNLSSGNPVRAKLTGAGLVEGDVCDKGLVYSLAQDCDQIVHLASVVGVRLAMAKGREMLRVSYLGTESILEAATKLRREVFLASSSAVYGKLPRYPVAETDDYLLGSSTKPCWLYSVGKLVEEHLGLAYFREQGTRVKIGRFFNVIGPYQVGTYGMVVPTFVSRALKGEPLLVYGNGRQTRTFVYIEDALDALELILNHGEVGQIYNIGGVEEITILELAEKVKSLTRSSSAIRLVPYAQAFGDSFEETQRRVPDISRLKNLGYSPRYNLEQALAAIIAYYQSREGRESDGNMGL